MSVPEPMITLVDIGDDMLLACMAKLAGATIDLKGRAYKLGDHTCEVLRLSSVCLTFNRLVLSLINPDTMLQCARIKMIASLLPMLEVAPHGWTIEEVESDWVTKMDIVHFLLEHEDAEFVERGPYKLHGGVDAIVKRIAQRRLGKVTLIDAYKAHGERIAQRIAPAFLLDNLARCGFVRPAFSDLLTPGLLFSILRDCQLRVTAVTSALVTARIKTRVGAFKHQLHCFQDAALRMDRSLTKAMVQRALLDHIFSFCDCLGWPDGLFAAVVGQLASDGLLSKEDCDYESWREAMVRESNPCIAYCAYDPGHLLTFGEIPTVEEGIAHQATLRKLEKVQSEVASSLEAVLGWAWGAAHTPIQELQSLTLLAGFVQTE